MNDNATTYQNYHKFIFSYFIKIISKNQIILFSKCLQSANWEIIYRFKYHESQYFLLYKNIISETKYGN